ncbi:hypothetical protein OROHE_027014 [Orobanche hederae]
MAEGEYYVDDDPHRRNFHNQLHTADLTYLSQRLEDAVLGGPRPAFSWVTPARYRVEGWGQYESPVPAVVSQEEELCIPYQAYNLIRLQINLIVRLSPPVIVAPEISLPYLVRVFTALPIGQQTFTAFLERLHHDGFLRSQDYDEETQEIAPVLFLESFHHNLDSSETHHGAIFQEGLKSLLTYRQSCKNSDQIR